MKPIDTYLSRLRAIEPVFFVLMLIAQLVPIWIVDYFITVDGPAHVYNARLMLSMLGSPESCLHELYGFTAKLVPNWSGHAILLALMTVFKGATAEKLMLSLYIITLPMSFRFLLKSMGSKRQYLVYLVFPFICGQLFYYGFYNFHIGIVAFLAGAAYWQQALSRPLRPSTVIIMMLLSILAFFSHLFAIGALVLTMGLSSLLQLYGATGNENSLKSVLSRLVLVLAPVSLLMLLYISQMKISGAGAVYIPLMERLSMITDVSPAKGVRYGKEAKFSFLLFLGLLIQLVSLLLRWLKGRQPRLSVWAQLWGLLSLFFLTTFLLFPDGTSSFGMMSPRFLLFFFLSSAAFLATVPLSPVFRALSLGCILYANVALLKVHVDHSLSQVELAKEITAVSALLPDCASVTAIINDDYFLYAHLVNYLGADRGLITWKNYEADNTYFPLRWQDKAYAESMDQPSKSDYVFVVNASDRTALSTEQEAQLTKAHLVYGSVSSTIQLYHNPSAGN